MASTSPAGCASCSAPKYWPDSPTGRAPKSLTPPRGPQNTYVCKIGDEDFVHDTQFSGFVHVRAPIARSWRGQAIVVPCCRTDVWQPNARFPFAAAGARCWVRCLAQNCADMTWPAKRRFFRRFASGDNVMETGVNIAFRTSPGTQSEAARRGAFAVLWAHENAVNHDKSRPLHQPRW